jgi:hypothetical protein
LSYRFPVSITSIIRTMPVGRLRAALRSGAAAAALTSVPLLAAGTALADTTNHKYDGENSGPGLTVLETLGIYVGIPVAIFVLISFLVVLPGWVKGDRNRKAAGWLDAPAAARAGVKSSAGDDEAAVATGTASGTGGASGSW